MTDASRWTVRLNGLMQDKIGVRDNPRAEAEYREAVERADDWRCGIVAEALDLPHNRTWNSMPVFDLAGALGRAWPELRELGTEFAKHVCGRDYYAARKVADEVRQAIRDRGGADAVIEGIQNMSEERDMQ